MLSVNEPEAQLVELLATVGAKVSIGDPLCTLETTKATFEVQSEVEGYVHRILVVKGQDVTAGAVLLEISPEAPATTPEKVSPVAAPEVESRPDGLLISDKGMRLAKELGVALEALPLGVLVTEAMVRKFSSRPVPPAEAGKTSISYETRVAFDANKLLIIGARGHAKTIIDLVRQAGHYQLSGLIADPAPAESDLLGVPVLGGEEVLQSLYDRGIRLMVNGVGGIERNRSRYEVFVRMAERGFAFPRMVHPKAVIEPSAEIAAGAQVFGMAFIGSASHVGYGAIINTGAIVSHDCRIGEFAHITPGVVLAGSVDVGAGALVGMGVTTAIGVRIGEWARIGNGARLNGDVPPHGVVQAGATWP
jgi:sugar O-acyltransferase (sialic acid O-acetyltransferase NeuD family)